MENTNPYAPPRQESPPVQAAGDALPSWPASIGKWIGVCYVSAVPSFIFGLQTSRHVMAIPMMLCGIACFVVAYAFLGRRRFSRNLMSQPLTANCIRSAFTLRVIVSVVFPIGGANDMWVGILSMTTTGALFHGGSAPGNLPPMSVLATTLIQGFYLNVEVFLVALILFGLSKAWHAVAG